MFLNTNTSSFISSILSVDHLICRLTRDYSGCNVGPGWRPCSDTTLQRKPWVSADRSTDSDTWWWLTRYTLTCTTPDLLFLLFMTHSEVLDDLWTPPWFIIHLCQHFQHIYRGKKKKKITLLIMIQDSCLWNCCGSVTVTLDCLSSRHLFQVHRHVSRAQGNRGRYVDKGEGTGGQVIWERAETNI